MTGLRYLAAGAALAVTGLEGALFVAAERQLRVGPGAGAEQFSALGPRWVWAVAVLLPWVVGAVLLLAGRARIGTAVLLAVAPLMVASAVAALRSVAQWPRVATMDTAGIVVAIAEPLVWSMAAVTAVAAWAARPRGGWRLGAPGPTGPYVAAAVLAWLPSAFVSTQQAPPGAPRAFARAAVSGEAGLTAAASISSAVVVAVLLVAACRLRPRAAGAVLLAYAVPSLVGELGSVLRVFEEPFLILTPTAVLGMLGLVGIVALAIRWLVTGTDDEASG